MIRSESELKKMTKMQLKQWLTKNQQRLPATEQLKSFYFKLALEHWHFLQQEEKDESQPSSRVKKTTKVTRTKKKTRSTSNTDTSPTKPSPKPTRTRRRTTVPDSPSASLNRSKKRTHRIPRKTPTKNSPSLQRSLKKKRARVRRATADPVNLAAELQDGHDHKLSSSESDEDTQTELHSTHSDGARKRKSLSNNINIDNGVHGYYNHYDDEEEEEDELVQEDSHDPDSIFPKKRELSPMHKQRTSPQFKKTKSSAPDVMDSPPVNNNNVENYNDNMQAPLPYSLQQSPLTPQDELIRKRRQMQEEECGKSSLLSTPALNRTGIQRIDTPSKAAMRDEIRGLLGLDSDADPRYPVPNTNDISDDDDTTYTALHGRSGTTYDKITPGAPPATELDEEVLTNVLGEMQQEKQKEIQKQQQKQVYKAFGVPPSPPNHNSVSFKGVEKGEASVQRVPMAGPYRRKSFVAQRTIPSPTSPNMDDMEPMSPAINSNNNNSYRSYMSTVHKEPVITTPPSQLYEAKHNIVDRKQQKVSPKRNTSGTKTKHNTGTCKSVCGRVVKVLCLSIFAVSLGALMVMLDGVSVMQSVMDDLQVYVHNFGHFLDHEREPLTIFCDTGRNTINGESMDCVTCPQDALLCANGRAQCKANYVVRDDKCVIEGIVVRMAYELNKQIIRILAERRGQYECGELVDGEADYKMAGQELMSICNVFDESQKHAAFEYFKKSIMPESNVLEMDVNDYYYTYKSLKSPMCRCKEWALDNILGLIATAIVCAIMSIIWCKYKTRQWEAKRVDEMVTQVFTILEDFERYNGQQHVPVDAIRQRIKPESNRLWNQVDSYIQKDPTLVKSMRMMDGRQKRCLGLSSASSMNSGNMMPNRNDPNTWSPARPMHQWNY